MVFLRHSVSRSIGRYKYAFKRITIGTFPISLSKFNVAAFSTSTGSPSASTSASTGTGASTRARASASTRTSSSNPKADELYKVTVEFLKKEKNLDSTAKSLQINRLINDWSQACFGGYRYSSSEAGGVRKQRLLNSSNSDSDVVSWTGGGGGVRSSNSKSPENADTDLRQWIEAIDKLAHVLLDEKESMMKHPNEAKSLNDRTTYAYSINEVLGIWCKAPESEMNGERAGKLLSRLEEISEANQTSYHITIISHIRSLDNQKEGRNGAKEGRKILEKMNQIGGEMRPDIWVYNGCMHGFALRGMVKEVEELLNEVEKAVDDGNDNMRPDVYTYSILLNAYNKCNKRTQMEGESVAKRTETLLHRMIQRYEQSNDRRIRPNQFTFGTAIDLVAKTSQPAVAGRESDRILQWMIDFREKETKKEHERHEDKEIAQKYSLEPTTSHFITVLLAHSKSAKNGGTVSLKRMEELLMQMETLDLQPTYQCFVIYLNALSKSRIPDAPERAEEVLNRIEALILADDSGSSSTSNQGKIQINNYGYNSIMDAWARSNSRGRAKRVEAVFERMQRFYEQTGNDALLPDKFTYACLMNAIIKDKEEGFAERCADILAEMEASDRPSMQPDSITYGTVIRAFRTTQNIGKAEAIIKRMETDDSIIDPDAKCYGEMIDCYNQHGGHANSALSILERCEKMYESGDITKKPKAKMYCICINIVGRSRDPNKAKSAESIFQRCLSNMDTSNASSKRYYFPIFNSLIGVYSRSNIENKVQKALGVIEKMEELGFEPTVTTYNGILSTCSRLPPSAAEKTKRFATTVAVKTMRFLQQHQHLQPDSESYNQMLFVCGTIKDSEEKSVAIEAVTKSCCNDGYLSRQIISSLGQMSGASFWSLLGVKRQEKRFIDINSLDPAWSRNAK